MGTAILNATAETLTINLRDYVLDEVIVITLFWLLTVPWAALFMSRSLRSAREIALFIGIGVPLMIVAVYSLVGAIRAFVGLVFLW